MKYTVKDPSVLKEDAFVIETIPKQDGSLRVRFLKPGDVLAGRVKDRTTLLNELEVRQHNVITLHTEDISTRRWHIERERPALRYFCRKFGVPVPGWLEGCGGYEAASPATFKKLFGDRPLHPVEFKTWGELFPELKVK